MQAGCDMLIIGGGPGGYAAALYAARSGLETLVLENQYHAYAQRCSGGKVVKLGELAVEHAAGHRQRGVQQRGVHVALHVHFSLHVHSFFIAAYPISTVQTYAQVLGIISIPISGTASAHSTTGM